MGLALVAAVVVGCDGSPRRTGEENGESSNEPVVLDSTDVRILGTSESIAIVRDLQVVDDGTVWVMNSVEPLFIGLDSDGRVLRTHGSQGGGPEEFGQPGGFVVGGLDGRPWIFDSQRHALMDASGSEDVRPNIPISPDAIPPAAVWGSNPAGTVVKTHRLGDEVVLPVRSLAGGDGILDFWLSVWTADLVAFDPTDGAARVVVDLGEVLGDPSTGFEPGSTPLPFPMWYRLWSTCSSDEIRVYDRLRNEVRGFTADGVEIDPVPLPPVELDEVRPRDFARATFDITVIEQMGEVPSLAIAMDRADSARVIENATRRIDATPTELANLLPRYVDFHCDDAGTQWIQMFDLDEPGPLMEGLTGSRRWWRISPDGERREVRLPERFDAYRFTPERIWGVQRDRFDVASVAWIETP